jgi:hypothetical protein
MYWNSFTYFKNTVRNCVEKYFFDTSLTDQTVGKSTFIEGVLIEELWKEDEKQLKPLPISDLPIFSIDSLKVNKYGEIELDGEKFVIHKARIKQVLVIKKEWDQFSCITNDGEVIYQEFRSYMNKTRAIPWNDILDDWERKPRSVKYSRFFKYLPEKVQAYLIIRSEETKKRVLGLKKLLEKHTLNEIQDILSVEGSLEREPHELGYILEAKKATYPEKIKESHTPEILIDYEIDLNTYDKQLCLSLEGRVS